MIRTPPPKKKADLNPETRLRYAAVRLLNYRGLQITHATRRQAASTTGFYPKRGAPHGLNLPSSSSTIIYHLPSSVIHHHQSQLPQPTVLIDGPSPPSPPSPRRSMAPSARAVGRSSASPSRATAMAVARLAGVSPGTASNLPLEMRRMTWKSCLPANGRARAAISHSVTPTLGQGGGDVKVQRT